MCVCVCVCVCVYVTLCVCEHEPLQIGVMYKTGFASEHCMMKIYITAVFQNTILSQEKMKGNNIGWPFPRVLLMSPL